MAAKKPLGKRIVRNLGKKWIQVIVSVLLLALGLSLSHRILVKKPATTEAGKKKEEAGYKFMHCDKCMKEMGYQKTLAHRPAMACKCPQGDAGFWEPTESSVANGAPSPLRFFYTAVLVESLLWLISLYFLLARNDAKPPFYFLKCVHCQDMLRYTEGGFGALVVCPSCALYIRIPEEEEALTMEDHEDDRTDNILSHFQTKLIDSGYKFPEAKVEGEEAAPPDAEEPVESADPSAAPSQGR